MRRRTPQLGWIAMRVDDDFAGGRAASRARAGARSRSISTCSATPRLPRRLGRLDQALALEEPSFAAIRECDWLDDLGYEPAVCRPTRRSDRSFRTVLSSARARAARTTNSRVALLLKGDAQDAIAEIEQEPSESWRVIGLADGLSRSDGRPSPKKRSPRRSRATRKEVAYPIACATRCAAKPTWRSNGSTRRCSTKTRAWRNRR